MRIGHVDIDPVSDGTIVHSPEVTYADCDPKTWEQAPGVLNSDGDMEFPYGGFLLRGPDNQVVLHDAGAGPRFPDIPDWRIPAQGQLLRSLEALGVAPDDVTDVVYSHLHADHIGWASVDGTTTFRHAHHHVHTREWDHFLAAADDDVSSVAVRTVLAPLGESVRRWEGPCTRIAPWLRLVHTPGHTPGSVMGVVESLGHTAVMAGDLFHTAVDVIQPDVYSHSDTDPAMAADQRSRWLNWLRSRGGVLYAPHFTGMSPLHFG